MHFQQTKEPNLSKSTKEMADYTCAYLGTHCGECILKCQGCSKSLAQTVIVAKKIMRLNSVKYVDYHSAPHADTVRKMTRCALYER